MTTRRGFFGMLTGFFGLLAPPNRGTGAVEKKVGWETHFTVPHMSGFGPIGRPKTLTIYEGESIHPGPWDVSLMDSLPWPIDPKKCIKVKRTVHLIQVDDRVRMTWMVEAVTRR
jgi:hypothetical protein